MSALLRKEIRLILPLWLVTMALAISPICLIAISDTSMWWYSCQRLLQDGPLIGVVLLSVASFGQEFALGTFSTLLAQPVERRRIWRCKVGVAAGGLALAWAAWSLGEVLRVHTAAGAGDRPDLLLGVTCSGVFVVTALAGGLCASLLFRQTAAALWFAILPPIALLVLTARLWETWSASEAVAGIGGLLLAYSAGAYLWARRLFLTAQDVAWTGGTVALPAWLEFGRRTAPPSGSRRRRAVAALWRKEFQLHQGSLVIGAGMFALHLAVVLTRKAMAPDIRDYGMLESVLDGWWGLWLFLPFLVGAAAVAEERKYGTLESQLVLPASRRLQFTVKLAVALLLGMFLGGLMPWAAEWLGGLNVTPGFALDGTFWERALLLMLVAAAMTGTAFYASTLTRNLIQALGATAIIGPVLAITITLTLQLGVNTRWPPPWGIPCAAYLLVPLGLWAVASLAYRNYQRALVDDNLRFRNLLTIVGAFGVTIAVTETLYQRPWELLMTLEPPHGPAQLAGPVRPRICWVIFGRVLVLLPDGRIWEGEWHDPAEFFPSPGGNAPIVTPTTRPSGVFIGGSNWVALASSGIHAIGLQSDGSLWRFAYPRVGNPWTWRRIASASTPERLSADSDWQAIAATRVNLLALKRDGTLWGFDASSTVPTATGRIGQDATWTAIFGPTTPNGSDDRFFAIKNDLTVWRWRRVSPSNNRRQLVWQAQRVDRDAGGGGYLAFSSSWRFDAALRRDGSLWVSEANRPGVRVPEVDEVKRGRLFDAADWADFAADDFWLIGVKKNGRLFLGDTTDAWWTKSLRQPSKYSDWIAVGEGTWNQHASLAADGTLSVWGEPLGTPRLFGPTRRPRFSLNIFADAKAVE